MFTINFFTNSAFCRFEVNLFICDYRVGDQCMGTELIDPFCLYIRISSLFISTNMDYSFACRLQTSLCLKQSKEIEITNLFWIKNVNLIIIILVNKAKPDLMSLKTKCMRAIASMVLSLLLFNSVAGGVLNSAALSILNIGQGVSENMKLAISLFLYAWNCTRP